MGDDLPVALYPEEEENLSLSGDHFGLPEDEYNVMKILAREYKRKYAIAHHARVILLQFAPWTYHCCHFHHMLNTKVILCIRELCLKNTLINMLDYLCQWHNIYESSLACHFCVLSQQIWRSIVPKQARTNEESPKTSHQERRWYEWLHMIDEDTIRTLPPHVEA